MLEVNAFDPDTGVDDPMIYTIEGELKRLKIEKTSLFIFS